MPKLLSRAAVEKYNRDGYYFPIDVLSEAETRELRAKLEAHEGRTGGPINGDKRHRAPSLSHLVERPDPQAGDPRCGRGRAGPEPFLLEHQLFHQGSVRCGFVSWHQDATYWGLSSPDVMTVWVAFTPANLLNGCMKFMPGSHKVQLEHKDTFDKTIS